MKYRALLSAVALCFAVAGCESKKETPAPAKVADKVVPVPAAAPTPPPASGAQDAKAVDPAKTGPKGCKKNGCKVKLDVTGAGEPECSIAKQPDPLYVWKGNPSDTIVFTVATNGWSFDTNGVSFATGHFNCSPDKSNSQVYNCTNPDGATPGKHDYKVRLKHTNGKKCTKDPSVVNGVDDPENTPAGSSING